VETDKWIMGGAEGWGYGELRAECSLLLERLRAAVEHLDGVDVRYSSRFEKGLQESESSVLFDVSYKDGLYGREKSHGELEPSCWSR
jgi:hypothetical protein